MILYFLLATYSIFATYTPENLIIATDLDDVVLQKNWGAIAGTVVKNVFSTGSAIKAYKQFKKENSIAANIAEGGEAFYIYLNNTNQRSLARKVLAACTHKYPIKGTADIMQRLARKGFKIYTATNMGSLFFAHMQKKYPHLFNDSCIRTGLTVDYTQKEIIKKPDTRYYQELTKRINPPQGTHILFIDDKIENVTAAQKAGLLGIHFKNPKQLRKDLIKLGIIF